MSRRLAISYDPTAVAHGPASGHTPNMTLKSAALLALIGTGLLTILLAAHFILDILNAARGLIPAIQVLTSLIHVLASLSVAVFFYIFASSEKSVGH
jgi:hypothetical protein